MGLDNLQQCTSKWYFPCISGTIKQHSHPRVRTTLYFLSRKHSKYIDLLSKAKETPKSNQSKQN